MKQNELILIFFITLLALSCNINAGEETGFVVFQHGQYGSSASSSGKMFFFLEGGVRSSRPGCATASNGERWVIDNDRPAASMQLSILIAAFVSGKQVGIRGSHTCDVHGDTETAVDIVLQ